MIITVVNPFTDVYIFTTTARCAFHVYTDTDTNETETPKRKPGRDTKKRQNYLLKLAKTKVFPAFYLCAIKVTLQSNQKPTLPTLDYISGWDLAFLLRGFGMDFPQ